MKTRFGKKRHRIKGRKRKFEKNETNEFLFGTSERGNNEDRREEKKKNK